MLRSQRLLDAAPIANTVAPTLCLARNRARRNRARDLIKITRLEYEYEIPFEDARELLDLTVDGIVEKTRYYHRTDSHVWEIDVFKRHNKGLVVAEIELKDEDDVFEKPSWVGEEVSDDPRYANSSLSTTPYKEWA